MVYKGPALSGPGQTPQLCIFSTRTSITLLFNKFYRDIRLTVLEFNSAVHPYNLFDEIPMAILPQPVANQNACYTMLLI